MKKASTKAILEKRAELWPTGHDISYSLYSGKYTLYSFSYSEGVQVMATDLQPHEMLAWINAIEAKGVEGSR